MGAPSLVFTVCLTFLGVMERSFDLKYAEEKHGAEQAVVRNG
jgi:hypothetical protein